MFSIIIPYYKKRKYIERCLNAILVQTYQDFEIIVIDDGSNDDLKELIEIKYTGRVKIITQKNGGVSCARNSGIKLASRDYIAFLDADDYWSPFYLEKAAKIIEHEENVKIVGFNYTRFKHDVEIDNIILSYKKLDFYFQKQAIKNSLFTSSSTIIIRSFFKSNPGFNLILKSGEDIDVWFRAVLSGGNAFYIKNTLVYYSNEDENQATSTPKNLDHRFIANINSIYFKNGEKIYPQEFYNFLSKYMYSSLYIMYFQKATHERAVEIKKSISKKYLFAELYYSLPYFLGESILKNQKARKIARQYFKFIFKYLHTT